MTWRDTFRTATDAVRTHRLRSALTMLGILIGITAVVLTVGLGQAPRPRSRTRSTSSGTNLLVISPGQHDRQLRHPRRLRLGVDAHRQDAEALADPVVAPDIQAVAATSTTTGSLVAGEANWTTTLTGTTAELAGRPLATVSDGRFIDDADERQPPRSSCSARTPRRELFGTTDPVGETVSYNGMQLEVIGVLEPIELLERRLGTTTSPSCRSARTRSGWSVARTATRSARST